MNWHLDNLPTANLYLKQVRLINPAQQQDLVTDVVIESGQVTQLGSAPSHFQGTTLDCDGYWLMPGAIDLCTHLCEPGYEHKGTIHSESKAAAAGGITHLCCTPNTNPVIDTPAVANLVFERAFQSGYANVLPIGALTSQLGGEMLSEMQALQDAGCIGVTQMRAPIKNTKVMLRCLEYAATFGITVFFQSQDYSLAKGGVAHGGQFASHSGLPGIPSTAETIGISRDLLLVEQTGVKAHFGQLSTARSVEIIATAQHRGLPVTADVAAHQLHFNEERVDGFQSAHHVIPPYRTEEDRLALLEGLKSGVIGMVCSNHQPHEAAAKAAPFAVTEPGISGIETLLSTTYHWVKEKQISEAQWVNALSNHAASLLDIDAGNIVIEQPANLVLFDPKGETTIARDNLLSEGKNNPWLGDTLPGKVLMTICEGQITHGKDLA